MLKSERRTFVHSQMNIICEGRQSLQFHSGCPPKAVYMNEWSLIMFRALPLKRPPRMKMLSSSSAMMRCCPLPPQQRLLVSCWQKSFWL